MALTHECLCSTCFHCFLNLKLMFCWAEVQWWRTLVCCSQDLKDLPQELLTKTSKDSICPHSTGYLCPWFNVDSHRTYFKCWVCPESNQDGNPSVNNIVWGMGEDTGRALCQVDGRIGNQEISTLKEGLLGWGNVIFNMCPGAAKTLP